MPLFNSSRLEEVRKVTAPLISMPWIALQRVDPGYRQLPRAGYLASYSSSPGVALKDTEILVAYLPGCKRATSALKSRPLYERNGGF